MSTKLERKLRSLPSSPGVYIFKNDASEVLYVGKATSLKDRVSSYFQSKAGYARMIELFIDEVSDLEIRKTDTVLEAYILEQGLIKDLQPKYNAMGKDDKSFVYVVVTKEEFPKFLVMRKTDLGSDSEAKKNYSKIYGPYTSRRQIDTALKILRKIFPYHSRSEHSEKGCLDYQIGLCPGPYDGAISRRDYLKNIRGIEMILRGKKSSLIRELQKDMEECSKTEDFECAAGARNKIFALKHIRDIAMISKADEEASHSESPEPMRIEAYDISNISGSHMVGSMVVFDNSKGMLEPNKNEYRKFRIKSIEGINDVAAMEEVLRRRLKNSWQRPSLIVLDGGRGHLNMARRVLRSLRSDIPLLAVAKGPTRKKLDLYPFGNVPEVPENIIEQMRDEAHRFAITYHRKLRSRAILE
ncbi:MAG: GIY-YIG nuclease family protein [Candidatus Moranbacteria bacterium]|nr:GIY-YIG nuclease family protein [Candidatus Moranbacteria bacterium]